VLSRVFLVFLFVVYSYANPYKNISVEEKLSLFTNYFINESLKENLPKIPKKGLPKKNDYNYEPTKYELYYNYVQRIKAIEDSLQEEQKALDDKYEADIYKYNKKLRAIKRFYKDDRNFFPILDNSFNKALKVVYGKPLLEYKNKQFLLTTQTIYNNGVFSPKEVLFKASTSKELEKIYDKCELSVTFLYDGKFLSFDELVCSYKENIFQGKIATKNNEKIKLNVKINDDIFKEIKLSH